MEDLRQQARNLGIEVDGRWGPDRLRQEIDRVARASSPVASDATPEPEARPAVSMLPVRLSRGYVPMGSETKAPAGSVIDLPAQEARSAVERGIAVRADAF